MLQLALLDQSPDPCTWQMANQSQWGQGALLVASHDHGSCVEKVGVVRGLVLSGANFQSEVTASPHVMREFFHSKSVKNFHQNLPPPTPISSSVGESKATTQPSHMPISAASCGQGTRGHQASWLLGLRISEEVKGRTSEFLAKPCASWGL